MVRFMDWLLLEYQKQDALFLPVANVRYRFCIRIVEFDFI